MVETYGQLASPTPRRQARARRLRQGLCAHHGGEVKFFKDGYTDLRGRFDYARLNTNELEDAEKIAVLIMSDTLGAVVRETRRLNVTRQEESTTKVA